MDLSTLPPIAFTLDTMYALVAWTAEALSPLAGASATMLAVVALTMAVRLLLLPAAVAQVRAEVARRRLAPAVAALRRRYAKRPEHLQKAIIELYTDEKVSPLAGCLPTLLQAPVLSAVYSLFVHQNLAGHANLLLTHTFAGIPLGANVFAAAVASSGSLALPQIAVFLGLLIVLGVIVELTRRANRRWAETSSGLEGRRLMRILPFVSVAFAAIAPLAAAVYLVTSAAWTLAERAILRGMLTSRRPRRSHGDVGA